MISEALTSFMRPRPRLKARLRTVLHGIGYDTADWMRIVMYRRCFAFLRSLGPDRLDVLEISGGPQWIREFTFRSHTSTSFPEFDICAQVLSERFDVIIADQVFEHLKYPYRAGRNVLAMLKPGGHFIVTVPFLVRIHRSPTDCTRWTEEGLSYFLQECGFYAARINTDSWGNRACLRANLTTWSKRGLGSLANEPDFPLAVWAFAQKGSKPADLSDVPARTTPFNPQT
jgi:SAM-dependent methyltransferase